MTVVIEDWMKSDEAVRVLRHLDPERFMLPGDATHFLARAGVPHVRVGNAYLWGREEVMELDRILTEFRARFNPAARSTAN